MSLLRIRMQEADGKGVRRAGGAAEGADSYIERLLKLIPAEAIGIYLVGLQIVGAEAENHVAISKWTLACLVFVFVFRAIASAESPKFGLATGKGLRQWWKDFKAEVQWGAVLIATFSFFVWASALGYPVAPNLSASLNACSVADTASNVICVGQKTGTLILLLWTPLAAFLYAGHRIGNLAPPDNDDDPDVGKKKPRTPSPVDSAPERTQTRRVVDPANDHRGKPNRLDRPPYNAIVLLHAFAPGHQKSSQIGTGWLVGPRHVVTAGHVVMNAAKIRGWLAYDSATDKSAAYFESKSFSAHPDYVDNASAAHDIAIIKLAANIDDIDPLDRKNPSDALPRHIYSAGYPEDHGGLTMLEARGTPVGVNGNDLYHDIDTDDGQSGSPIWYGMGKTVTGVHAAGSSDAEPDLNYGIYLSNEIFDWITASTS